MTNKQTEANQSKIACKNLKIKFSTACVTVPYLPTCCSNHQGKLHLQNWQHKLINISIKTMPASNSNFHPVWLYPYPALCLLNSDHMELMLGPSSPLQSTGLKNGTHEAMHPPNHNPETKIFCCQDFFHPFLGIQVKKLLSRWR